MINSIESISKLKKKRLLVVCSDQKSRNNFVEKIFENFPVEKIKLSGDVVDFSFQNENKTTRLKILSDSPYEFNSNKLDIEKISSIDGLIFLFFRSSYSSLDYINKFYKEYHSTVGSKFFPSIFVLNEKILSTANYSSMISPSDLEEVTMNRSFPLIKIKNDFDLIESNKIFNSILEEIEKEKNNDFPYSLVFRENMKINCLVKYSRIFSILNISSLIMILLFTIFDTIFIIDAQDFTNEAKKIDDIFFGIRLNINAINFISSVMLIKKVVYDREKFVKIRRLQKYVIFINIISWAVQGFLHFRVQHVYYY